MKSILPWIAVMATTLGTSSWADSVPMSRRQLTVCLGSTGDLELEHQAKLISSGIFSEIGVKLEWRGRDNCSADGTVITLSNRTPATLHPDALAYALLTNVVVFYDRVKNKPGTVAGVLGHVMAHEIGHILQGVEHHSESGVMKAHWTGKECREMTWRPLHFTSEDVLLINRGLEEREKHLGSIRTQTAIGSRTAGR
jgi:hypothetical protein